MFFEIWHFCHENGDVTVIKVKLSRNVSCVGYNVKLKKNFFSSFWKGGKQRSEQPSESVFSVLDFYETSCIRTPEEYSTSFQSLYSNDADEISFPAIFQAIFLNPLLLRSCSNIDITVRINFSFFFLFFTLNFYLLCTENNFVFIVWLCRDLFVHK